MNTPRLLLFGLFLPLTLICPPENRIFTRKYSFLSVGLHLAIMDTFLSRTRGLFLPMLTDIVIGLLSNVAYYRCTFFHLMRLTELIIPSPGEIKKKMHFTMVNFFPKRLSRNQSINQFIYVNTWDGVAPIIRAKGMTIKAYHGFALPSPFL